MDTVGWTDLIPRNQLSIKNIDVIRLAAWRPVGWVVILADDANRKAEIYTGH